LVRTTFVWRGTAYQRFAIKNHGGRNVDFELSFGFASDFADIFEVPRRASWPSRDRTPSAVGR
jgi:hypothetical protein